MRQQTTTRSESRETVDYVTLMAEVQDQYLADDRPWVVCYSGGKGSAIIVLGTRKAESPNRARAMSDHDTGGRLRKHDLPNAYVYAPIADLSNNEVWAYLLQARQPWGSNNRELLALYRKACKGGECPFVIETGTQSCGKSRFGCWVCTVIDRDQAMESYVGNGHRWMKPLLELRNKLYAIRQQTEQDVPRQLRPGTRFGAFLLSTRRQLLKDLPTIQTDTGVELITDLELAGTKELLRDESRGITGNGLCFYTHHLRTGSYVRVLADYDIQQTPRQRLGPFFLAGAEVLSCEPDAGARKSSRVMYKVLKGRPTVKRARPAPAAARHPRAAEQEAAYA